MTEGKESLTLTHALMDHPTVKSARGFMKTPHNPPKWARHRMLKIAILSIILTATAPAASPWTKADTAREIAYNVVLFVDWKQTREFAQAKYRGIYFENNPLIGGHNPSRSRVNQACIVSSVGHYAISRMLPEKSRHIWQYVTLGLESGAIGKNYMIGIRAKF